MSTRNEMMSGNPRYQPKRLREIWGYDNLFRWVALVEMAVMDTLAEIGVIPSDTITDLTPEVREKLLAIPTTEVDRVEREVTKHDIRAWVQIAQGIVGPKLARWVHVPLTSYDALDTARTLSFLEAHRKVVSPSVREVIKILSELTLTTAGTVQIGRTHGQHALPITVGFWLGTILQRIVYNARQADLFASQLVGKISGAVGAYNAQVGVGIIERAPDFEDRVLARLGVPTAKSSTQILPPEPLAYYLFSILSLSAAIGQFGRDCRHLMRSEIGEIFEPFGANQVGSSTMAHKRNPMTFENLEGTWLKNKVEFGKVLECMISEHQRDLVGSSLSRDLPVLVINLVQQLDALLRKDKEGTPFLSRIRVDKDACLRNFAQSRDFILAEPMYVILQMAGYGGDAHALINHQAVPFARQSHVSVWTAASHLLSRSEDGKKVLGNISREMLDLLQSPVKYVGLAVAKAIAATEEAQRYLGQ